MRLLSHSSYDTPRLDLLRKCNQLSVNQLISYHIVCQTHRIFWSKLPDYHFKKLFVDDGKRRSGIRSQCHIVAEDEPPVSNNPACLIDYKKAISRGTFFYQASLIWNSLPFHLRKIEKNATFKKSVKLWVSQNIRPFK